MPYVVVDAGALVELLLRRSRALSVSRALGDDVVVAPHLIDLEALHALRQIVQRGEVHEDRAQEAVVDLVGFPLDRVDVSDDLPSIWALRHNITPYDACYVVLARALDAGLVTSDARLGRAPGLGVAVTTV